MTCVLYLPVVFPFSLMSLILASFIVISLQDGSHFPGRAPTTWKRIGNRDAPFVQLRGINYWFWAHLKCTGHNSFFCTFFFALRISNVSLQVLTSLNKGSLHNRPFIEPTEANAIRKKCRVRLAWLIKRQLCRLKQRFQYLSESWMSPLATTALRG